jgi:hypothetical protein
MEFAVILMAGLSGAGTQATLQDVPDAVLCKSIQRQVVQYRTLRDAAMFVNSATANCLTKRVELDMTLITPQVDEYIGVFVSGARAGVCDLADTTMANFAHRGWKFQYTFRAEGRANQTIVLDCFSGQ